MNLTYDVELSTDAMLSLDQMLSVLDVQCSESNVTVHFSSPSDANVLCQLFRHTALFVIACQLWV